MKPNRYPYSGKKGHTLIKADHELVEKVLRPRSILIDSQRLTTKLQVTLKNSTKNLAQDLDSYYLIQQLLSDLERYIQYHHQLERKDHLMF